MVKNSENSSAASLEEVQFTKNEYKEKAEWYAERITKFLIENSATYPSYFNGTITGDDIVPNSTNFTSSLFLDDDCDTCKDNLYK